jgi:hypothetical protein
MKPIITPCLIAALALMVLPGCSQPAGPKTMRVWGDVSFDGKPVEEGSVTFESADGSPPAQALIKAGHYDLSAESGPVAEKSYVVKINAMAKTGKTVPNVMGDGAATMDILVETIPPVFNALSTIKKTISADPEKNRFDFKLQKSGAFE